MKYIKFKNWLRLLMTYSSSEKISKQIENLESLSTFAQTEEFYLELDFVENVIENLVTSKFDVADNEKCKEYIETCQLAYKYALQNDPDYDARMRHFFKNKMYNECLILIRRHISKEPLSIYYAAFCYFELQNYNNSFKLLNRFIDLIGKNNLFIYHCDPYTLRGDIKTDYLNDFNGAIADYSIAITQPGYLYFDEASRLENESYLYAKRGKAFRLLKDYHFAFADYNKAFQLIIQCISLKDQSLSEKDETAELKYISKLVQRIITCNEYVGILNNEDIKLMLYNVVDIEPDNNELRDLLENYKSIQY